jgi:aminocarboxymuconate-semialdehyde decarboxylase
MAAKAIDAHTHFVPSTMPSASGRNSQWPSIEVTGDTAAVTVGGKLFRIIDSRSWSVTRRLDDMGEDGIDMQIVSPMPELLSHWFPAEEADAFADHVNQAIAELCAGHPRHFVGIGMVPVQDPALAARRLERVRSLGLHGVEIGTHINSIPLGDASLNEFYAAAEEADLALLVHPLHPAGLERIGGHAVLAAVAAFPLETALAATSLLTHGVTERFPRLRILLSHGGGALPWILPRLDRTRVLDPSLQHLFARAPGEMARRFYYDTVLYDDAALRFLANAVGTDNIVVGSDYPFSIRQPRPADFARRALGLSEEVFSANASRFLRLGAPAVKQSAI